MSLAELPCDFQPITIIELVLDRDADGTSYYESEDRCAFQCTPTSYWFSDCKAPSQIAAAAVPNAILNQLTSIAWQCSDLQIGSAVPKRGSLRFCLQDDESKDPDVPGGYISSLFHSQKYWEGRKVVVYTGDCTQTIDQMDRQVYYITKAEPPNAACQVCFTAKDPLSLLDTGQLCPDTGCLPPLTLRERLPAEIQTSEKGLVLDNPFALVNSFILSSNIPIGIDPEIDKKILCTEYVCHEGEVLRVVAAENGPNVIVEGGSFGPAGWNLVLVERAVCGSQLAEHKAGATLSPAAVFQNCHVADVLLELLRECAAIEEIGLVCCDDEIEVMIDCESVEQFRCKNPLAMIDRTIICQPVEVSTLINELGRDFGFKLDFDETTGLLSVVCIQAPTAQEESAVIRQCDIQEGSWRPIGGSDRRSKVSISYGTPDCSESVTKQNAQFSATWPNVSINAVPICERRKYRTIKTVQWSSRWFTERTSYLAQARVQREVCLFECEGFGFEMIADPVLACSLVPGQFVRFEIDKIVDGAGQYSNDLYILTGKCKTASGRSRAICFKLQFQLLYRDTENVAPGFVCGIPPGNNLADAVLLPCEESGVVIH